MQLERDANYCQTMGQGKPIPSYRISGMEVLVVKGNTFLKLWDVFTEKTIPVAKDNIPTVEDRKWSYLKYVELPQVSISRCKCSKGLGSLLTAKVMDNVL